jgi:hypothetical protein
VKRAAAEPFQTREAKVIWSLYKVQCGSRQKRKALSALGLNYDNVGNDFPAHRRRELLQHLLAATFDVRVIGKYFHKLACTTT